MHERRTRSTTGPLALLALALAAGPASAQQAQRPERNDAGLQQYCTGDYFRFCGNIAPDSPEIDRCFARNWTALTPGCRTAIDAHDKANAAPAAAPKGRKG